jgi:hypothetical protein
MVGVSGRIESRQLIAEREFVAVLVDQLRYDRSI